MKEITRIRAGKKSAFPDMIDLKDQQGSKPANKREISIKVMEVYLYKGDKYISPEIDIKFHYIVYNP